jgi:spermidine/putrescine transport system substrate-binding protein
MIRVLALLIIALACIQAADKTVTVYMYSEYIDPEIPKQFEKLTGQKVVIDVYEAQEEMLAKMRAGGASQYDVVVASDVVVQPLIQLGLVRKLEPAKIPNAKNVAERFRDPVFDRANAYSWPYQWGTVGLMYRKDAVPGAVSWALIFDPAKQPGPFVLMDEMRSQLGVALKAAGKPMSTREAADLKAAGELLVAAKGSAKCLGFDGGVGGKNKVMAGEAAVAVVYNGDAVKAMVENPDAPVAFAVPVEGTLLAVDNMLISAKAPNPDGAHAFIDYILDAKVGAQLSNFNRYATPNQASMPYITKADANNPAIYPPAELLGKMASLEDVGDAAKLYDEVWTSVKSR